MKKRWIVEVKSYTNSIGLTPNKKKEEKKKMKYIYPKIVYELLFKANEVYKI